jgi:spermidine synthase
MLLVTVFAIAIFLNAALLFSVQPLFTKMVLPLLGGSPAVWNTCLLFFQTLLLAGYLYAHVTSRWLNPRNQAILHLTLLASAVLLLPIHVPASWAQPPGSALPIVWLLGLLAVSLGLPFFLLSAGAPMMQRWFATTRHAWAQNPYFLYAASNLGSFAALLAYPFVIEPRMRISEQSVTWLEFYYALLVLMGVCAIAAIASRRIGGGSVVTARIAPEPGEALGAANREPTIVPDRRLRIRWVLLSFAPSSMLIGVTTYLSTDIAAVPFLWVIPLALYLLTFVLVFARRRVFSRELVLHAQLLLGLVLVVALCLRSEKGIIGPAVLHLLAFFFTAMMCHGELAASRPKAEYLTEFYLWMSFGGMLGGVFNVLVAPVVFNSLAEYAIALAVAFALRPSLSMDDKRGDRLRDVLYPAAIAIVIWIVYQLPKPPEAWFANGSQLFLIIMMIVVFFSWKRPIRLALGAGAMYASVQLVGTATSDVLLQDRSFFGMYRVRRVQDYHILLHGTTTHGGQSQDPSRRTEPLTYYYRGGPVSDLFDNVAQKPVRRVGIVGLGTGAISCYGRPDESWTFYEIDPLVAEIARSPLFSYLRECAPNIDVVIGDARLKLAEADDGEFDLILVDAFSSDAVPAHLLTREAVALYFRKLRPDGVLAFHISNRFMDLTPVVAALARDANLAGALGERTPDNDDLTMLRDGSRWIALARDASSLADLMKVDVWQPLSTIPGTRLWTDDYTDVLSVIKW